MQNYETLFMEEMTVEELEFPTKDFRRGIRRKKDQAKAIRKEHIANAVYPGGYHAVRGSLRKGKIHCSCPMCAAKTNAKKLVYGGCERYGKNYKPSDRRKVSRMLDLAKEAFFVQDELPEVSMVY